MPEKATINAGEKVISNTVPNAIGPVPVSPPSRDVAELAVLNYFSGMAGQLTI